ncbi:aspartoacylase [Vibrio sp. MA40-2]|uniref:aspartoacylase n=1 Tax=Vibrio sp. MA40-2 TaxID=3391828 RepID=UPI0039A71312
MTQLKNIALVGGTHGNELSGIYLVKKWVNQQLLEKWHDLNITTKIANPRACEESVRYIESDLNREFYPLDLADNQKTGYEQLLAKKLNQELGPKGQSPFDFIIDLHNTTSNMGACLMLLKKDDFNLKMAAYVKHNMPESNIFFQDNIPEEEHSFLITLAKQGITIEVGAQPNSVLQHETLELMESMTQHVLDFVVLYNKNEHLDLPKSYEAFQYSGDLLLPLTEKGERNGVVSKHIDQRDFSPVEPGQVVMETFDGQPIYWEGDYTTYPLFINEAAYRKSASAMTLSKKIIISDY